MLSENNPSTVGVLGPLRRVPHIFLEDYVKICRLRAVESTTMDGSVSLRGPRGRGARDPARTHITDAGFKPDEEVFLVSRDLLYALAYQHESEPGAVVRVMAALAP